MSAYGVREKTGWFAFAVRKSGGKFKGFVYAKKYNDAVLRAKSFSEDNVVWRIGLPLSKEVLDKVKR